METRSESSVVIRDLETVEELRAVEDLQKQVWGVPDLDVVPLTQMIASTAAGGVLLGAFDGTGLVGFAYGFAGIEDGKPIHHSHMLAVLPEYRNQDLGRRLKLEQRERALAQGIELMTWTFDPLQSLNAHFNFNKLGVVSDRYLVDFYGQEAKSFLHRNGTDRLWVSWLLKSRRVAEKTAGTAPGEFPDAVPLLELGEDESPRIVANDAAYEAQNTCIEIPLNIGEIEGRDFSLAVEWRAATREVFTKSVGAGYLVKDFYLRAAGGKKRGAYILVRGGLREIT